MPLHVALIGNNAFSVPPRYGYGGRERRLYELAIGLAENGCQVELFASRNPAATYHRHIHFPLGGIRPMDDDPGTKESRSYRQQRIAEYRELVMSVFRSGLSVDAVLYSVYEAEFSEGLHKASNDMNVIAMLGEASIQNQKPYHDEFILTALSRSHARQFFPRKVIPILPSVTRPRSARLDGLPISQTSSVPRCELLQHFLRHRQDYLVHLASIRDFKCQRTSIALAKSIGMPLILVGPIIPKALDPSSEEYFNQFIRPPLHENDGVYWLGNKGEAETEEYLSFAKASLWPSGFEVSAWREPFGRAVAESILLGVPVLAFCKGGHTELIEEGKTGYLFNDMKQAKRRLIDCFSLPRPVQPSEGIIPHRSEFAQAYLDLIRSAMADSGRSAAMEFV